MAPPSFPIDLILQKTNNRFDNVNLFLAAYLPPITVKADGQKYSVDISLVKNSNGFQSFSASKDYKIEISHTKTKKL